jgi:hypothetical protein
LSLPAFFTLPTIVAAIACLVAAGLYGVALFRGEKGELLPLKGEQAGGQPSEGDSNNKKKFSLSSLGQAEEGEAQPKTEGGEEGGKKGFFNIKL